ncbi:hypothetical protein E6Q11_03135 [Candidatus Dojkabacteria bacterium]|uniref:Uncharacterized protein n=1 Tax=Candidatus Dojkabacteria bacterium TaxID=2099670 RepID=A0A5C7J9F2_9BACT|nr:MAG: hypothetical protein E6Q11_03135 [Candidatus Dojkabacteria bacterium]
MSFISDFKSAPISLFGVNGGNTSTDTSLATLVGSKFSSADGRVFALVQNGASALVSGVLVQSPASIGANHTGLTCATAAIGATQITVTLGGTAVTANQYAGGFAVVSAGTGIGQTLRIASHPAQSSTSGTVVLTLEDPLSVATAVSDSKVSLTLPQYGSSNGAAITTSGVVVCPTTLTGRVIGATIYPIPASTSTTASYGFIQTNGAVAVKNQGGTTIGLDVMPSGTTAGSVATYVVATSSRVGTSTVAGEDGKAQLITLQL